MGRRYGHVDSLSEALDNKQLNRVLAFLTDDCVFVAGNGEPVRGKENIKIVFEEFFQAIKSTAHIVTDMFESDESLVHRGDVTYTRLDNSILTVNFCDVFKMREDLIREYYIYIDWSELFK
ncbi:MAG: nuclear transport factor 2 family protein [Bacteroidales bacterium]|nr:nuclear transport factor 2 family protein [Bacteroidales bacterium]